jgi:hypothetical protein
MYCNLTAYGCYLSTFLTISKLISSPIQPLLRSSFTMVKFIYLFNNIKRGNYIMKIMFSNKIDIFKNKPNWKKQKFATVVTKLWHCDEIRRFDGTQNPVLQFLYYCSVRQRWASYFQSNFRWFDPLNGSK